MPGAALTESTAATRAGVAASGLRQDFAVAAAILAALLATSWLRPLWLPDEGRYVGVAWEMMRSGDWLVPTLNGLPFFHKPPLFYWITAASMSLFGANEWAARAAPMAGAWLGAFALFRLARAWRGERAARLAVIALLAQPLFFIGGQFANLDMLVAGCITATVALLAHASLSIEDGRPGRGALLGAYAMAALGVLAKGLIGAVIPALVVLAWLAAMRRWRVLKALASLRGAALFLAIAAPWFVAMQRRFPGFLDYLFVQQHFRRYLLGGFNNVQPIWFYPAALMLFSLPWLPWLWRALAASPAPRDAGLRLLMRVWIATTLLFFSLPRSKPLGYILPAVPPLAFLLADALLARGTPAPQAVRRWWASAGLAAAVSLAGVGLFALRPHESSRDVARALGALRAPHEPVFMLGRYDYDVPFYAHLIEPVFVAADNEPSAEAGRRDGWRSELADAARFAPASAPPLIDHAALRAGLCRATPGWVLGPAAAAAAYPFLAQADAVASHAGQTLWRIDAAQPAMGQSCAPMPGSAPTLDARASP